MTWWISAVLGAIVALGVTALIIWLDSREPEDLGEIEGWRKRRDRWDE